jgi:hypothetical protein
MPPEQLVSHQYGGGAARPLSYPARLRQPAIPGNAIRRARRLIPRGNRVSDRMAAHAIRAEIRSLSRALATEYVCIGSTDLVLRRLFASLIVPLIGHAANVADMDIPVGRQSHWPISRIPITFRE